jgi:penicillin-binding protein 2
LKLRALRVFGLVFVVIAVICGFTIRLMNYQITDGAAYRKDANKTTVESIPIVAPRGEILDRYGTVLATNTVGYSILLERTTFPTAKSGKENSTILEITDIMTSNGQQWIDSLPISTTAPYSFNQNSDADIKALKTRLTDNKLVSDKLSAALTADSAMNLLKKLYKIPASYTQAQARTVIGVRYGMDVKGFGISSPYTFAKNVSLDSINQMLERSIPGIEETEQYSRIYPDGTIAPQVIGNVRTIHADQYKKMNADIAKQNADAAKDSPTIQKYALDAIIGQNGLESSQEKYLRGINGTESIEINSTGTITGKTTIDDAKPGNNVVTTLDASLQKVLQQSLADAIAKVHSESQGDLAKGADCKAGSAVVENIKTGEILAMASCPSYDNSTFWQNYTAISNTPGYPLNNKALQAYRPGSSYKPCVAVSALMNGIITKDTTITCNNVFDTYAPSYIGYDDDQYLGNISVVEAIEKSSNVFFNTLGDRLNKKGSTLLEQTAKALGLGQPTGIELPEDTGAISGPTYAKAKGLTWYAADPAQSGIGQSYNMYTPLQLANYIGTIVNGGKRTQVHIVKDVKSYDNTKTILENQPKIVSDLKIPDDIVNTVKVGMNKVTSGDGGTAEAAFANFSLPVGGKTGTSQVDMIVDGNKLQVHNGLFLCFAPYADPQIVVAVVIENCAWGNQAADVATNVLNYLYLNNPDYSSSTLPISGSQLIK